MTGLLRPTWGQTGTLNVAAAVASTVTRNITVTNAGDILVLAIVNTSRTSSPSYAASGVSGAGATWLRGPAVTDTTAGTVEIWYGYGASSGAQTVTITTPGATDNVGCQLQEWQYLDASTVALETASYVTATGNTTTPTVSPAAANLGDLVSVASLSANTQTANPASPYTTEAGPTTSGAQKAGVAYVVAGTVGANASSWTQTSGHWAGVAFVLRAQQPM